MEGKGILEKADFEQVPLILSGEFERDSKVNTHLYLKLVKEGQENGFCPVLIDKDMGHYIMEEKYGFTDSREDYPKIAERLIDITENTCNSVWIKRIIYNYFMDCIEDEDEVDEWKEILYPPKTREYEKIYRKPLPDDRYTLFKHKEQYYPEYFRFEDYTFVKIPVKRPWEVLAWLPMGGFNWCPDEEHQIALAKCLYEFFGARIAYVSFDVLIYYLPHPLVERSAIEQAAHILVAADQDTFEDFELAVERVRGRHIWRLWWD